MFFYFIYIYIYIFFFFFSMRYFLFFPVKLIIAKYQKLLNFNKIIINIFTNDNVIM